MDNDNNNVVPDNGGTSDDVNAGSIQDSLVSGDELQRMAQEFAQREVKPDTNASATSDTAKDIYEEEAVDLNEVDQTLAEIQSEFNKPATESAKSTEAAEPQPADDFPFPSVASKHDPEGSSEAIPDQPVVYEDEPLNSLKEDQTVESIAPLDQDEHSVKSLQDDIAQDFAQQEPQPSQEELPGEDIHSDLGVGSTYYKDLSQAMGANEPKTMSELIQKARFEQDEQKIYSPTSSKNLKYIIGAFILLFVSIVGLVSLFGGQEEVEFITEQKVRSIVYSDEDLGLNTTGVETFQTKNSIRKILQRDFTIDSVSQIYYVKQDPQGNLRRMGVKDIFDTTQSETPKLLYDNIENDFMHGVYTTDKNYPFIVLKTLSYDRAFDGMKEWEPTMVDDLASYFDLPTEATDRSLIENGFSDDVIKNKNVRVARFVPRESDKRGLLDFLKSDGSEFQEVVDPNAEINTELPFEIQEDPFGDSISQKIMNFLTEPFMALPVHAQVGGTLIDQSFTGGSRDVCYRSEKKCVDLLTGNTLPSTSLPSSTVACYDDIAISDDGILGKSYTREEVGDDPNYICRRVLSGGQSIGFETAGVTEPVCFDPVSGDRLATEDTLVVDQPSGMCFKPYQCNRVECRQGDRVVDGSLEGQPGIECVVTREEVDLDFTGKKSCTQFNDLLTLKNIKSQNICFDEFGKYVPLNDRAGGSIQDYYNGRANDERQSVGELLSSQSGLRCITPQNRYQRLCVNSSNQLINGVRVNSQGLEIPISESEPGIKLCFEPFPQEGVGEQFEGGLNQELRQKAAALALRLQKISLISSGLGFFNNDASDAFQEAADFFWSIAYADLLENEIIETGAIIVRRLEQVLAFIDPGDSDKQIVADIREVIDFIKQVLGLKNNVTWVTLGNRLPVGVDLYPGDSVEDISAVQESLVLLGLMDPLSVTGELDLVTQKALQSLIMVNGGEVLSADQVFISAETLQLLQQMVSGADNLFGGEDATINDYFTMQLGLGSYSEEVQSLQIILYAEGYDISSFDGIYDQEVCEAVQQYQADQGLEIAEPNECQISLATIDVLNTTIRDGNYLGSGFTVGAGGALEGKGSLLGTYGPGNISFEVDEAEASSLREGDVILLYTFLDEETILITRHESVINEIIKRRSLTNIFN